MPEKMLKTALTSILLVTLFSCNNNDDDQQTQVPVSVDTIAAKPAVTDPFTLKLQDVLTGMEKKELSLAGTVPTNLEVSDVHYDSISMKQYYTDQHIALEEQAKLSVNKEKTQKALSYLDRMAARSSAKPEIYKVQFHLKALVGKIIYDEPKIIYLNKELVELELVFPS
jgi:hypothetical protein